MSLEREIADTEEAIRTATQLRDSAQEEVDFHQRAINRNEQYLRTLKARAKG